MKRHHSFWAGFVLACFSPLWLIQCQPVEPEHKERSVVNISLDDTLKAYDWITFTAVSDKDTTKKQVLFDGKVIDGNNLKGIVLDTTIGDIYTVTMVGIKDGKVAAKKELKIAPGTTTLSKDLPIEIVKTIDSLPKNAENVDPFKTDTIRADSLKPETTSTIPAFPEIWAVSTDTAISEGDSLFIAVHASSDSFPNALLSANDLPQGASFDSKGQDGSLIWQPGFDQGREEPYLVTFILIEGQLISKKVIRIKVKNLNRPPKLKPVVDQQIKEGQSITFKVEVNDPDNDTIAIRFDSLPNGAKFDGGELNWATTVGQSGHFTLVIHATDGMLGDSITVIITVGDLLPPPQRPSVESVTPTKDRMPTWKWKTGGGGIGVYRYRLNHEDLSQAIASPETTYTPASDLDSGAYTLFVQEKNADGVWSLSGRFTVRIDLTPPDPPLVLVAPSSVIRRPTFTWASGGNQGKGDYRIKLDDQDMRVASTLTKEHEFTPQIDLEDGLHTLYVQERDSAENWSSSAWATVMVDLTPPKAPIFADSPFTPLNSYRPRVRWRAEKSQDLGPFRFKIGDTLWSSGAEILSAEEAEYTPKFDLDPGMHIMYVQQSDSLGNWSATAAKVLVLGMSGAVAQVGFTLAEARYTSLALTRDGKPIVAYSDVSDSNRVSVMRLNGNSFEMLGSPGFSQTETQYVKLALDANDRPHVAYRDFAHDGRATVMQYNGASWQPLGSPGFSPFDALYVSFVISKANTPYVSFMKQGPGTGDACVMKYLNGSWQSVGKVGFSEGMSHYITLAVNSKDVPYVTYHDAAHGDRLSVMRFNGSAWEYVGTPGFTSGNTFYTPAINFDPNDVPYVAYTDGARESKTTVMRFTGANWEYVGTPGFSVGAANEMSMAFHGNTPYVAFRDRAFGSKLSVMALVNSAWQIVGSPGFSAGVAATPSLAVDSSGTAFVAFQDIANGRKATVLRVLFNP